MSENLNFTKVGKFLGIDLYVGTVYCMPTGYGGGKPHISYFPGIVWLYCRVAGTALPTQYSGYSLASGYTGLSLLVPGW